MKSSQEDIDHMIRQRLLEAGQTSDWDLPSDEVWDAVAQRIRPEKKGRWAFWWILTGSMVVIIAALLFMVRQQASPLHENVGTSSNKAVAHQEAGADAQTTSAEIADIPKSEKETESTDPISDNSNHSSLDKQRASRNTVATQSQSRIAGKATNPQNSRDGMLSTYINTPATPEDEIENISRAGDANMSSSLFIVSESEMAQQARVLEQVSCLQSGLYLLTEENISFTQVDVKPGILRTKHSVWSLAAALSPSLGTRRIVVPDAQPRVRKNLLLQEEEPAIQLGFGVSALHELSPRWSLGIGLEYSRFLLNSSTTHQIRYTRAGEMLNDRGNFENRLKLNLNTSYGELSTDVIVERSSDMQIEEHQFINLALQTRQSMQVLRVPVSARYQIPLGTWNLSCYGGLSANVLLENKLEFRAVRSLNSEIVQTKTLPNARLSSYKDFAVGYQFGIGFEMPLDRQWSLVMGPSVSGYLVPVYENRHVVIYPLMAEMHVGVSYRL